MHKLQSSVRSKPDAEASASRQITDPVTPLDSVLTKQDIRRAVFVVPQVNDDSAPSSRYGDVTNHFVCLNDKYKAIHLIGGEVDANETSYDCILREWREEVGTQAPFDEFEVSNFRSHAVTKVGSVFCFKRFVSAPFFDRDCVSPWINGGDLKESDKLRPYVITSRRAHLTEEDDLQFLTKQWNLVYNGVDYPKLTTAALRYFVMERRLPSLADVNSLEVIRDPSDTTLYPNTREDRLLCEQHFEEEDANVIEFFDAVSDDFESKRAADEYHENVSNDCY